VVVIKQQQSGSLMPAARTIPPLAHDHLCGIPHFLRLDGRASLHRGIRAATFLTTQQAHTNSCSSYFIRIRKNFEIEEKTNKTEKQRKKALPEHSWHHLQGAN